ncbi:MAG: NB-ARC domain-containing protein, partial [Phycisphaerales bacterium JB064]
MTGRRSSRMADALAAASGVSASVLWGNVGSMVYDAMTKPGGFAEAVACIDPAVAAPVIAVATGLGIVKKLKGKSSKAELQKLVEACEEIKAQTQDLAQTLQDVIDGTSPLNVELDDFTKLELSEFIENRWAKEGSAFRQTLNEEFEKALAEHPRFEQIIDRLDKVLRLLERRQIVEATDAPPAPRSNFAEVGIHWNRFYTGRDDDLLRLREAMATGSQAIAHAIDGEGGIGKTEIARAYAFLFGDEYDGVWWLDASEIGYTRSIEDLFELLNGSAPPDGSPPEAIEGALRKAFTSGAHLLVLDNVEKLERFEAWRLDGPSRVLATTRLRHPSHAGIQGFEVGVLSEAAATDLLCKLVEGRTAPPPRDELAAIARELGGHALAVSVAGAYLAHYPDATPAEVLGRLHANPFDPDITTEDGRPRDPMALKYEHDVRVSLSLHFERFEKSDSAGAELAVLRILACCHPEGIPVPLVAAAAGLEVAQLRPLLRRLAGVSI